MHQRNVKINGLGYNIIKFILRDGIAYVGLHYLQRQITLAKLRQVFQNFFRQFWYVFGKVKSPIGGLSAYGGRSKINRGAYAVGAKILHLKMLYKVANTGLSSCITTMPWLLMVVQYVWWAIPRLWYNAFIICSTADALS